MASLGKEARALQNPAFGAALLWNFCDEYYKNHSVRSAPPLPLLFSVLPMVLHEDTRQIILSTRHSSGLRALAEKFERSSVSKSDVLATLQKRIETTRPLTMASLQILLSCGLVTLDLTTASIFPSEARGFSSSIPAATLPLCKASARLGRWMSDLTMFEIAATLRLVF